MSIQEKNREFIKVFLPVILVVLPVYYLSIKHNKEIFFIINGFQSEILGYPMIFLSAMADGLFVLMISSAVYRKKKGYFWTFIISYVLTSIIIQGMKQYFHYGRPLMHYSRDEIYVAGDRLRRLSFPSGHSASAMVLAYYLAEGLKTRWKAVIFAVGILAGVSRVYIGAHYPKDVTTGLAIGFLICLGIFSISKKRAGHANREEYKYNVILVSLTGVLASIGFLYFHPDSYKPVSGFVDLIAGGFFVYFTFQIIREFFTIYKVKKAGKTRSIR